MDLTPILKVEEISFRYNDRLLFAEWSAVLELGITWVRGPNGTGKTTLLKLVGGALEPSAGKIGLKNLDSKRNSFSYRRETFLCGSAVPDLPWLKVQELIDLFMSLYPGTETECINTNLVAFNLQDTLQKPVAKLSLGQQKKLQLTLALSLPVTLLLFDEPFNALDAAATQYLRDQLMDASRLSRQCIVITSHIDPMVPITKTLFLGGEC